MYKRISSVIAFTGNCLIKLIQYFLICTIPWIIAGGGIVKSATLISLSVGVTMWKSGILGEHNPKQLGETILFSLGVNLALRGGDKQKRLRHPAFNPQITIHVKLDGVKYLKYVEDPKRKNDQGGLGKKCHQPKVVHVYPSLDSTRCPVRLYEKYIGRLPLGGKHGELYLHAKRVPLPNQWYENRCLGINIIHTIVKCLCNLAGFEGGSFSNQSLRATSCTRMFDKNQDKQVIKQVSGHMSNAVRIYKTTSDKFISFTNNFLTLNCLACLSMW